MLLNSLNAVCLCHSAILSRKIKISKDCKRVETKYAALSIFVAAYLLFVVLPTRRTWVAILAAALIVATRTVTVQQAFFAVNWNVMGIFVGTLVIADLFIESRMPAYLAELIVNRSKNTCFAILFICALTGFISAFVENVATIMIIAPIALSLARKLNIHPVNLLIAIAVSSNLQGAGTLIGDPPSMLLAGFSKMNFLDFFFYKGRLSIFFAVQIGAVASMAFLYWVFRKEKGKSSLLPTEKIQSLFPSILLAVLIIALALSSFFDPDFSYLAGLICLVAAIIGLVWDMLVNRGVFMDHIKALDWDTTFFLIGVFVLVGSLTITGWTETIATSLSHIIGGNILLGFVFLVVIAIIMSAFIDNVPFLAAMLPVVMLIAAKMSVDPTLLLFGLLLGASIGGNVTPIGAAANIVSMGILKKEGYTVSFMDFVKIGLPFTVVSVTAACAFVWLIWAP